MRIRTIALVGATAMLAAACGPQPGSAEWCLGVIQGTVQATPAEIEANDEKCEQAVMKEMLGNMRLPGQ